MRTLEIDASTLKAFIDVYKSLLQCLEAPPWHGTNLNAITDSVVYGGINGVNPPYTIIIRNIGSAPPDAQQAIRTIAEEIRTHIEWRLNHHQKHTDVTILEYD